MKSLFTAATGMEAQQKQISVISNNLANITTNGFKQSRAVFQDLMYEVVESPGSSNAAGTVRPSGIQIGSGSRVVATPTNFGQGTLEQSGRDLDVAIEGQGFFPVNLSNGNVAYTRGGSLAINESGEFVTQSGDEVDLGVTVPPGVQNLTISSSGLVSGRTPGDSDIQEFGQIQMTTFPNPAGLRNLGRNLYQETEAAGSPIASNPGENGAGTLRQGFLEGSNVNIAEELIRMILAQRGFEMNSKVVRTSDDIMSSMNQMR